MYRIKIGWPSSLKEAASFSQGSVELIIVNDELLLLKHALHNCYTETEPC
jgi:hypothetical protein